MVPVHPEPAEVLVPQPQGSVVRRPEVDPAKGCVVEPVQRGLEIGAEPWALPPTVAEVGGVGVDGVGGRGCGVESGYFHPVAEVVGLGHARVAIPASRERDCLGQGRLAKEGVYLAQFGVAGGGEGKVDEGQLLAREAGGPGGREAGGGADAVSLRGYGGGVAARA